jgi:hypothetical protein
LSFGLGCIFKSFVKLIDPFLNRIGICIDHNCQTK